MQGDKRVRNLVYDLARGIVEENGMDLIGVEYVKEGANWYLRLYIDKEEGVNHEDCERISRIVSDMLDRKDPIPHAYFLEVSSPGIERIIQTDGDFARYRGKTVNVHLYAPVGGKKIITGILGPKLDDSLIVTSKAGEEHNIPNDKIAQVTLAWDFKGEN